jgi:hypothetical protein
VETREDTSVNITLVATDESPVDESTLDYEYSTPANGGTVTGDGPVVTYTPAINFSGQDSFTFSAHDGDDPSNTATVTITIAPVKDYEFIGFQDPWQSPPPIYAVKPGSAVPLKWQYAKNGIIEPSGSWLPEVWVRKTLTCDVPAEDSSDPADHDLFPNDPGASGYRYMTDTDTWQFNWDTDDKGKGCYNIYVFNPYAVELDGPFQIRIK